MTKRSSGKNPLVSVIIPTRNAIRTIEICLKSVKAQTYKNIEIIVVDQKSKDGTVEIAKKYATRVLATKGDPFYSAPPISRNLGAKTSKGKYLFHIDSDMELTLKVIDECVTLLEKKPEILAVKVHERDIGEGFWSRAKILERKCYIGYDAIEAARFMRRETFFKLSGYDEQLRSAEDWDMSKRIQKVGKISEVKSFINHYIGKLSYPNQIKKKFNYGLTMERVLTKHGFNLQREFSMVFRIVYFQNIKLFILNPIETIGFLILRPSELLAYVSGMLWAKVKKVSV